MLFDKYEPIACHVHEQLEFAVMKRQWLDILWFNELGECRKARVLPIDVYTKDCGEYLCVRDRQLMEIVVRLDMMKEARWVSDGRLIE